MDVNTASHHEFAETAEEFSAALAWILEELFTLRQKVIPILLSFAMHSYILSLLNQLLLMKLKLLRII